MSQSPAGSSSGPPNVPPNVLLVVTDQQRADALGCAGHPVLRTPHLDRLAAEGVRFEQAITSSPLCMPARASLLTSLYPHSHTIWGNTNTSRLPAGTPTLFSRLQQAGYATAHVGKGHYYSWVTLHGRDVRTEEPYIRSLGFDYVHETTGPAFARTIATPYGQRLRELGLFERFRDGYTRSGERHPWDLIPSPVPVEEHLDSYIGRTGVDYLENYDGTRPFCLYVGFGGPHDPWDAPGEYATMYDPEAVPAPIPAAEPDAWVPAAAAARMRDGRVAGMTEAHARGLRANYYGKITLIDHWVGRLLETLERRGWRENTLVVFLSDHGEMGGDHGRVHKVVPYESSVRIPFIVRRPGHTSRSLGPVAGPGTLAGATSRALVETVDVLPTVLAAAGVAVPEQAQGHSLWPVLRGEVEADRADALRDAALSEVGAGPGRSFMLRTERYKYAMDGQGEGWLLHDLAEDPQEQRNLLGQASARALEAELRDRLLRRLAVTQPVM